MRHRIIKMLGCLIIVVALVVVANLGKSEKSSFRSLISTVAFAAQDEPEDPPEEDPPDGSEIDYDTPAADDTGSHWSPPPAAPPGAYFDRSVGRGGRWRSYRTGRFVPGSAPTEGGASI